MEIVIIFIQVILIFIFTISAALKFLRKPMMVQHWKEYRYPMWLIFVIATLEWVGVVGVLVAFWFHEVLVFAAILFALLMISAIHAHLFRAKHHPLMASNDLAMLLLSITLIILSI
ncbi:DoxX family protein [Ureibacillus sp. Re31]|uniref:DoxX family protein n=1 Tax=Ureibacillus galli TaxID=2762222 RepID=A0ABR8XGM5_9BACL|nr:DoxX family protein [Ureibacillus galli]MBD8028382.1 DoxX family protein [Ureibacillus galli]